VAVAVAAIGLLVLSATSGAPARTSARLPRYALEPNTVSFLDRSHGLLGTGRESCANTSFHCRLQGTVSTTSDGGKTWHVVLHTKRPVVAIESFHDADIAVLDDGETIAGNTRPPWRWHRVRRASFKGYCPKGWQALTTADIVDTNIETPWSVCGRPAGAGNEAKAVYRGRKRVAFTPFASHGGYGGISVYGYPSGISGNHDGFGLLWESRGTLYVTHDGGHHWHGLPKVVRPETDFGVWADADVYTPGTGFVLLLNGGAAKERLIETTDAGRTWRVVHRWRLPR
jgi:photosystem II stability/assembly factor-like uncharacterized protein